MKQPLIVPCETRSYLADQTPLKESPIWTLTPFHTNVVFKEYLEKVILVTGA